MGLEVRFVTKPFAELLPALEKAEVDMVISGMTITPGAQCARCLRRPLLHLGEERAHQGQGDRHGGEPHRPGRSQPDLRGPEGLHQRGLRTQASCRTPSLVATKDYDSAVQMVIDDEVDALIADYQICALSVWRNPGSGLTALMTPFTVEPLGIALPADAPLLVNLVQNYLDTLEYTGLLTQFKAKWLSDGAWVSELP